MQIKINNTLVEEKQSTKYLGIFIDNKLNWKTQIQHVQSKLPRGIGVLTKVRYFVDEMCLQKLYHVLIQSHINYNILNWSCTYPSILKPIETKIKKAIRVTSFSKTKYEHTTPLFKQQKVLPFYEYVCLRKASFMWKIAKGCLPLNINAIFTPNMRNHQRFVLPHSRTEHDKRLLEYSCIEAWNSVPTKFKEISNFKLFTMKYKEHLLSNLE